MKLTKREKILVYTLLCILIVSLGMYFLIIPGFNKNVDLSSTYDNKRSELIELKNQIITVDNIDQKIADAEKELSEMQNIFYTNYENEDVDKLITGLAIANNLKPNSLVINDVTEEDVVSYSEYLKSEQGAAQEQSTSSTAEMNKVNVYNVSLSVSGSIKNIQQMVNSANTMNAMKITAVSYQEQSTSGLMSLSFKLYMLIGDK